MSRRAILVVGMHRSGTSATARVLNLLGVPLPGELVGAFGGNPLGHWEPERVVTLHDAMLRSAGVNVNSVFRVDPRWFDGEAAAGFAHDLAGFVQGEAAGHAVFAVKDPRMALFLPLWRRVLAEAGVNATYVLPFRNPAEVAASLRRRQLQHYPDAVWPEGRADLLWLRYQLTAERETRGAPRAFLAYDRLLEDWRGETARIARQLGLDWPRPPAEAADEVDAYLRSEHRHERATGASGPWTAPVLEALGVGVADPGAGAEVFDAALDALEDACRLFEPYVRALELKLGAVPALRTEYVDFVEGRSFADAGPPALLGARRDLSAIRQSTTWRAAAPLQALVNRVRGRS